MSEQMYDLLIVGGGINGAGVARDAAGRGMKVLLIEMNDIASATSSASTKLIHGGLRYLEHYEFSLVRESLKEREVLLRSAPHLVSPMRFVLPHRKGLRPAWMIRLGLFLYDHIGERKKLPGSHRLRLLDSSEGAPLQERFSVGFDYSDCWVDDARLVVANLLSARENGAVVRTRTEFISARRSEQSWTITLSDPAGNHYNIEARGIVNAAGPWVDEVLQRSLGEPGKRHIRLVKGSHIIVPRRVEGDHAYLLQHPDGRIGFVIPYREHYTLIGTTDVSYEGDPAQVRCSEEEIDYMCELVNDYFETPVTPEEVVSTYSGVRPLYDDGTEKAQAITRDYVLDLRGKKKKLAPMLSIYGGKLTTFRKLAEEVLSKLQPLMGFDKKTWTSKVPLAGGDMHNADFPLFLGQLNKRYPWLAAHTRQRLALAYGNAIDSLLEGAQSLDDLGELFGADLYQREVDWMRHQEWAVSSDDILWRRSKLGMEFTPEQVNRLNAYLADNGAP